MHHKRVVFLLSSLQAGGSERVFWLLANQSAALGCRVTLLVINAKNPFFKDKHPNLEVIDLKVNRALFSVFKLVRTLRQIKPDCLFITGTHLNILMALLKSFVPKMKMIARESAITNDMSLHLHKAKWKTKLTYGLIARLYLSFNYLVAQSDEMKASLMNSYQLPENKIKVIHNPVLLTSCLNSKTFTGSYQLITIGRFTPEKGHLRLIEAMAELPARYSLDIYGKGPLEATLIEKINQLNLQDRVKICGAASVISELFGNYDFFILPSYTEGFPNVVLEALETGLPVVSFKTSGIEAMIINEVNGIIVEQKEGINGLVNGIIRATQRSWEKENTKLETQEKFAINKITNQYLELL